MIYKRHLLTFGPTGSFLAGQKETKKDKKHLSMGEDEMLEAMPRDGISPRTWWRKWLKLK